MQTFLYNFGIISMTVISFFCGVAFLYRKRSIESEQVQAYIKSRYWLSGVCLIISVASGSVLFYDYTAIGISDLIAICLLVIYAISRMLAFALSPTFDRHFLNRRNVSLTMTRVLVFAMLLVLINLMEIPRVWQQAILSLAILWVLIDSLFLVKHVFYHFYRMRAAYDDFYSEEYGWSLVWIPITLCALLAYVMGWVFVIFCEKGVVGVYSFIGTILLFIFYIFAERRMYFTYHIGLEKSVSKIDVPTVQPLIQSVNDLEPLELKHSELVKGLTQWFEHKGYRKQGVSIEDLAKEFHTNRTYLSYFLNGHYKMSFRQWIASLRISDAKEMLVNTDLREQDIAEQLGFSSLQSFIRTFSQLEGVSPSAFRQANSPKS